MIHWFSVSILIIVVGISSIFLYLQNHQTQINLDTPATNKTIFHNISVNIYDQEDIHYQFTIEKLIATEDKSQAETLSGKITPNDTDNWHIKAKQGYWQNDQLFLPHQTTITQIQSDETILSIVSQSITIDTEKQIATSPAKTIINTPQWQTETMGFYLNLKEQHLVLSEVTSQIYHTY